MRRGAWVLPEVPERASPTDELGNAFVTAGCRCRSSRVALQARAEDGGRGARPTSACPSPTTSSAEAHPTISSDLLPRIGHGDIEVKPNIAEFAGGRTVRFTDGSEEEVDLVVYCTGYKITFPFFDAGPDLGARQRDPALPPGRQPRAPGPLLHRPAAAARRDHAARRGAVGVDRRRARGQGRAAVARARWSAVDHRATASAMASATSPRSATRSRSTSRPTCARCAASGARAGCGRLRTSQRT